MKIRIHKTVKPLFILLLLLACTFLITCDKIDRDNPWDAKAEIDPSSWAPQNLEIELISITERKLTWQYGDHHIEGFKIDRKEGDGEWDEPFITLGKDARRWNDTAILPDASLTYSYRVYAYAGSNESSNQSITVSAAITPPSELKLDKQPETDIAYRLSWNDNSKGEEGFKIDRKTGDGDWIVPFDSVPKNHTEYLDTNVFAGKSTMDLHYRVYAYYGEFESEKVSTETEVFLHAPTNLEITVNSVSSALLSWQDNSTGEEGFKIDRKIGYDNWVDGYASVSANETFYTDNYVNLVENQYLYRIYAYYGVYNSDYDEAEYLPLEVSTNEVTNISFTSATSGGYVAGSHVDSRGIAYGISPNPDISGNTVPAGSGAGSFTAEITGLTPGTEYYARAYATNNAGTVYGNEVMFETNTMYGDGVTDIDGNEYITVIIGDQEWMAENLRVTRYNNEDDIPTGLSNTVWSNTTSGAYAIYNNSNDMLEAYGKLYNWYAVDDERGLCPEGWSVPSDADWTALVNYVVSQGFPNSNVTNSAANALKSCRQVDSPLEGCNTSVHPRWNSHGTHYGFDEFGFSALPGGSRSTNGNYLSIGNYGYLVVFQRVLLFKCLGPGHGQSPRECVPLRLQ